MTDFSYVNVESLKAGDVLVLGPRRVPIIGMHEEGGRVFIEKCTQSAYPLIYRRGDRVRILKA